MRRPPDATASRRSSHAAGQTAIGSVCSEATYPVDMTAEATPRRALSVLSGTVEAAGLARRHTLDLLVAFGSTVGGEAEPHDLDLAVRSTQRLDVLAFLQDVYERTGLEAVDVLDLRRAGPVAAFEALEYGIVLHEQRPGLFAEAHITAWARKADTAWLRRRQLEALAG